MALVFGVNDHITVPDDGTYDLNNPITVECLIRSDGIVDNGANYGRMLLTLNDIGDITTLRFLPLGWNGAVYYMLIGDNLSTTYAAWAWAARADHPLFDGDWHSIAFVTNDTPANCLLYIDGISEGAPDATQGVALPDPISTDNLVIGCSEDLLNYLGAGNDRHLDELRIWNDLRTAKEIRTNMYRRVVGGDGLVGCLRLDEPAGTTAYDLLKGPSGTLVNFPASPWEASGAISYMGGARNVI